MKFYAALIVGALSIGTVLPCTATEPVPGSGLRAEGEGRWQDAIEIYRRALARNPRQAQLWVRLTNIEVRLGQTAAAANTLSEATRHVPNDADLQFRLSQALAKMDQKQPALAAINEAARLAPENLEYLQARAKLANWNGDYATAQDSYKRILALNPTDLDAQLGLARSSAWKGDYNTAANAYRDLESLRPLDAASLMAYMNVEAQRGNYTKALRLGEVYRKRNGESLEYWQRMSELQALSGDNPAAAESMDKATRFAPGDPQLYFRLSQRYADAGRPKQAITAINRALDLDPKNLEFLRAKADLAAWSGDYEIAQTTYQHIDELAPGDPGALLGIARAQAWAGKTDKALRSYKAYVDQHPDVAVAWIEYAGALTDNGDYAAAIELLEKYRARFGDTTAYRKQRARTLAWAEHPRQALAILDDLHAEMSDDFDLHQTRSIALRNDHQPRAAVESLTELVRLHPGAKETLDTQRFVQTPLRSTLTALGGYREDSDDIRIIHGGAQGEYVVSPETRFSLAGDRLWLDAPVGGGFENIDGSSDAEYSRIWAGARHLISPRLSIDGTVGGGSVEGGDENVVYEVGADLWPRDALALRIHRNQDIYAVSPRAVSLGILRRNNQLNWSWSPDLRYTVDGILGYSTFSDDNERWDLALSPRRAIARTEHFNFDLGVSAYWFGFKDDPGHGYYAPSNYQRYTLNGFGYWKLSDDDGISITVSVGPYKDDRMDNYATAFDVVGEGFFGIYRDWMLVVSGSFSQNTGVATGAYQEWAFEMAITRRF